MDASTRLYQRLGEIPEDLNDPESLEELVVCAFGAFERYYLCWKTKSGKFRQDGYDLPPALNEWLNPTDGTTRDWASLQVVFGRGEEYFASDKNGKLEFKEPEVKKSAEEEKEKVDRQALRRSRAVSFLRPLSQASTRSDIPASEVPPRNRRTSSISSQRASRPPSLSYSTTGSEASLMQPSEPQVQNYASAVQPAFFSRLASAVPNAATPKAALPGPGTGVMQVEPIPTTTSIAVVDVTPSTRESVSASNQFEPSNRDMNRPSIVSIPEAQFISKSVNLSTPEECTCGCHNVPLSYVKRPTYANASVQTDPISAPLRMSLRVDTFSASDWSKTNHKVMSQDVQTPIIDNSFRAAPFSMGRMTNYFSKPGYQLGDSLAGGYHYYEQPVYLYQDEFGEDALR